MNKEYDILVVGELNVDLILNSIKEFPKIGAEILANEMTLTLGSSSAIFASNVSTLGAKVCFLGKIGKDDFGNLVINSLNEKGVSTELIIKSETEKTGATIVLNYDEDRAMVTHPGAMESLKVENITEENLLSAKHLHVSSIFLQPGIKKDIVGLFKRAKNAGLTTSLDIQWDPDEKWDVDFEKLLPFVDVFLPNKEEIKAITGKNTVDEALEALGRYANIIAVKLGNEGSLGYLKGEKTKVPAFINHEVVDAIGAGDSFNAGFIYQYLNKVSLQKCLEYGNLTGAVNTTSSGGTGAFISFEIFREIAKNKFNK
ncbi:MAG: carbohydrate kinase family protein [Bacteroidetes bacterium]|nr:MAG: carbohydrate kinase family protein [Bacteroidota bacterium]